MSNHHWLGLSLSGAIVGFVLGWFDLWRGSMAAGFVMTYEKIEPELKEMPQNRAAWRSSIMLVGRGTMSILASFGLAFVAGEYDACIRHDARAQAIILRLEEESKRIREQAERDVAAEAWRGRDHQR